jgi:hypothetical protein
MRRMLVATILGAALLQTTRAEQLQVTIYEKAHLPERVVGKTVENLRLIFHHAQIEIEWKAGAPDADDATLFTYSGTPGKREERRAACGARRDIAVGILPTAPSGLPWTVLGIAQPFAKEGQNVQLYNDHVAAAAMKSGLQHADVLAHAIGHVLLRSGIHDGSGLMAGIWKAREYGWISTGSMFFNRDQSKTMRESISGTGCPAISSRE